MNEDMKKLIETLNSLGYKVESIKDLDTPYSMKDSGGYRVKGFDIRISQQITNEE